MKSHEIHDVAELIKAARYCLSHEACNERTATECPYNYKWINGEDCTMLLKDITEALEAAEKRIDGLQKLVDINTERCEALRKQLRESHESYERHIEDLETALAACRVRRGERYEQ